MKKIAWSYVMKSCVTASDLVALINALFERFRAEEVLKSDQSAKSSPCRHCTASYPTPPEAPLKTELNNAEIRRTTLSSQSFAFLYPHT